MADLAATPGRTPPLRWRRLTAGERDLCCEVFGGQLDPALVRILALPVWPRPFVPNGRLIVWPAASALVDFSVAPLWLRSVLVHELTHVWQAAKGVVLAGAKLRALGKRAYRYKPLPQKLAKYNIERQAEIARHLYLARNGYREPGMPESAWLEDVWASR